jgi:integrase/recombinase XerD
MSTFPPQAAHDDGLVDLWLRNYRSPNTRAAYARDIAAFRAFAGPLSAVTLAGVQDFGDTLDTFSPSTAARRLSAVKSCIAFAFRVGYLRFDVAGPLQLPAIQDRLAERIMSEETVQRLLYVVKVPRDAALLRLIYGAGLRLSEACGIRWRDMAPRDDAGQVNVLGKGGKTRAILLPAALWNRIAPLRGNAGPDDPVFRSRQGGCLNRSQVHRIMKRAAKRAGLPTDISTHWMRHAHVSHALDRGCPAHVVQQTVGHASLATTSHYAHVRPGDSSARYLPA